MAKRYYWLKLPDGFFRQKAIKKLRKIAGGDTYTIIYLKMLLVAMKQDGRLYFEGVEATFYDELALDLDEEVENVRVTVMFLIQQDLMQLIDETEYSLSECAKMTGSESTSAARVRKYRSKEALQCNTDVTGCNEVKQICNGEIDVARFGDDETIIYRNYHGHCKIVRNRRGQDTMATVGDIVKEFKKIYREYSKYEGKVYVQIDDTGLGGGVTDRLKEVRKEQKLYKMQIIPINAAEKIETDTAAGKDAAEKYNNLTTAMWASMRDLLDNKQIVIEDDEQTIGQLSSRKYTMTSNGKLEIESKKEMKKRGLDSPDRADALALALYLGKIKKHTGTAPGVKELQELTKDNYWG